MSFYINNKCLSNSNENIHFLSTGMQNHFYPMGSSFCSIDLFVYSYANIMLILLLWIYNKFWVMKAALKLEKKCHAENHIVNSIWNSSIQEINKKIPPNKTCGYLCPIVKSWFVLCLFIFSFYPILHLPCKCATHMDSWIYHIPDSLG